MRSPGVVLRVSQIRAEPPEAAASAKRWVTVAIPDRWHRKFRAVRSPVSTEAIGPLTVPTVDPAATASPSAAAHVTATEGSSCANASVAQAVPASTPSTARHEAGDACRVGRQQRRCEVSQRREVLGDRKPDGVTHGLGVGICHSHRS